MPPSKTPPVSIPDAQKVAAKELAAILPTRESKYRKILDAMRELKAGEAVKFPFAKTVEVRKIINCLTSAIVNAKVSAPAGCSFYKRIGTNNELVIQAGPAHKRKARAAAK